VIISKTPMNNYNSHIINDLNFIHIFCLIVDSCCWRYTNVQRSVEKIVIPKQLNLFFIIQL